MRVFNHILISLFLLFAGLDLSAGPVFNRTIRLSQPDGSVITATVNGDEHFKITTCQGKPIGRGDDGWWRYCWYDAQAQKHFTQAKVGQDACVTDGFIPVNAICSKAVRHSFTVNDTGDYSEGHRFLVIPVQFSDVSFSCTLQDMESMINLKDRCVKEYFMDQNASDTEFSFTLTNIVTLGREASFYGKNDEYGQEKNIAFLVREGCVAVDPVVDFSQFDHIAFIYAGQDEADGGGDNLIWSHAGFISDHGMKLVLDGVDINLYSCTSELCLNSDGKFTFGSIGKFCHELGHNLGLPDLYDTWLGINDFYYSAGLWRHTSLMDGGYNNDNGNTPPYLNAIEREILGLGEFIPLEEGKHILEPVHYGKCFRIDNVNNDGEYFLLECRDRSKWDAHTGGEGMLAYHIDKSSNPAGYSESYGKDLTAIQRWELGEVNANQDHQCADLVEASGKSGKIPVTRSISKEDVADVFFPKGSDNLTPFASPSLSFWDGSNPGFGITDIRLLEDGNVSFTVSSKDIYILNTDVFQNSILLDWTSIGSKTCSIYLDDEKIADVQPYVQGYFSYQIDGLQSGSSHTYSIVSEDGLEKKSEFTTMESVRNAGPFIYLGYVVKDSDNYVVRGARTPLIVCNADDCTVEWTIQNKPVKLNGCRITLNESCTLKACVRHADGSVDILVKDFKVR